MRSRKQTAERNRTTRTFCWWWVLASSNDRKSRSKSRCRSRRRTSLKMKKNFEIFFSKNHKKCFWNYTIYPIKTFILHKKCHLKCRVSNLQQRRQIWISNVWHVFWFRCSKIIQIRMKIPESRAIRYAWVLLKHLFVIFLYGRSAELETEQDVENMTSNKH